MPPTVCVKGCKLSLIAGWQYARLEGHELQLGALQCCLRDAAAWGAAGTLQLVGFRVLSARRLQGKRAHTHFSRFTAQRIRTQGALEARKRAARVTVRQSMRAVLSAPMAWMGAATPRAVAKRTAAQCAAAKAPVATAARRPRASTAASCPASAAARCRVESASLDAAALLGRDAAADLQRHDDLLNGGALRGLLRCAAVQQVCKGAIEARLDGAGGERGAWAARVLKMGV